MRVLTDEERLIIAVNLLDERGLADYAGACEALEQGDIATRGCQGSCGGYNGCG